MAKLEDFFKKIPKRNNELRTVSSTINSYGDFKELISVDAVIKNIQIDLLIPNGTYIFDPEFGVGIHKFLFEPVNDITKRRIENLVNGVVARNKEHTNVTFQVLFFKNKKGFKINFVIEYRGKRTPASVTINESLLRTIP